MKEVSFPTPHTPHPATTEKLFQQALDKDLYIKT